MHGEWKRLGTACMYTLDFYWEMHDGKTAGLSKLELPGTDMLTLAKTARNVHTEMYTSDLSRARFFDGAYTTASPFHLTSRM